jgi:hypothetical protein
MDEIPHLNVNDNILTWFILQYRYFYNLSYDHKKSVLKFESICFFVNLQEERLRLCNLPILRLDANNDASAAADFEHHVEERIFGCAAILNHIQAAGLTPSSKYNTIARLVAFIVNHAAGSYLYANQVLDLVARGHLAVRSGNLSCVPRTLTEVYHLHCSLAFPTVESFSITGLVLSICLAAVQPMLLKDILHILSGCCDSGASVHGAATLANIAVDLNKMWLMLRIKADRVEFRHTSVRDWLQDPDHRYE